MSLRFTDHMDTSRRDRWVELLRAIEDTLIGRGWQFDVKSTIMLSDREPDGLYTLTVRTGARRVEARGDDQASIIAALARALA